MLKPDFKRSAQVKAPDGLTKYFTNSRYNKRWFVLDKTQLKLFFYLHDKTTLRGEIDLKSITSIQISTVFDAPKNSLDLCSNDNMKYTITAKDEEEMIEWAYVLHKAIHLSEETASQTILDDLYNYLWSDDSSADSPTRAFGDFSVVTVPTGDTRANAAETPAPDIKSSVPSSESVAKERIRQFIEVRHKTLILFLCIYFVKMRRICKVHLNQVRPECLDARQLTRGGLSWTFQRIRYSFTAWTLSCIPIPGYGQKLIWGRSFRSSSVLLP